MSHGMSTAQRGTPPRHFRVSRGDAKSNANACSQERLMRRDLSCRKTMLPTSLRQKPSLAGLRSCLRGEAVCGVVWCARFYLSPKRLPMSEMRIWNAMSPRMIVAMFRCCVVSPLNAPSTLATASSPTRFA